MLCESACDVHRYTHMLFMIPRTFAESSILARNGRMVVFAPVLLPLFCCVMLTPKSSQWLVGWLDGWLVGRFVLCKHVVVASLFVHLFVRLFVHLCAPVHVCAPVCIPGCVCQACRLVQTWIPSDR